jgi:molybdopterin-guanine dinucleotide biosynthesis protein A
MRLRSRPVGALLAGGAGLRIGGEKATVELHGKPLICYPLEAIGQVVKKVAILCKSSTRLPPVSGVTVWIEPERPSHPLVGITQALALAGGRPVLVCAADFPFVTPDLLRRLARANPGGAPAVVASAAGVMNPLLACYQPRALELLADPARTATAPLFETIAALDPVLLEAGDPDELFDVDTPDDLLLAAAMLDRRKATAPRPY